MKKTIVVMIILLLSLSGCGKGNTPTEYLSIASTTYIDPTTEKMVTSIHQYIPREIVTIVIKSIVMI